MKYLKKYNIFLEENEFDIKETDQEDVKMSKENLTDLKSKILDYNTNKSKVDDIYKKSDKPEEEIKKLLGPESENRNPFLVEYASLSRIEREINNLHDENVKDKLRLDDFKQELSLTKDETTKKAVNFKISDISNRMSKRNQDIVNKQKELLDLEKKHKDKMLQTSKNIEEWVKKISTPEKK
jgi:hypothetical protein